MKRILQIFLASVLVFSTLLCPTFAKDYEFQSDTEIVTFDDGSYIEIVTKSYPSITRASEKYAEKVFELLESGRLTSDAAAATMGKMRDSRRISAAARLWHTRPFPRCSAHSGATR